jgi:hypothetical protein
MIEPALLDQVLAKVAAATGPASYGDGLTALLRASFPGTRITVCGEDDIPARLPAAATGAGCRLYYVDASEHCLKLTTEAAAASGIVVALCGDDD